MSREDTQDQLFNISGWKKQLYGETFPREEMSDWLDNGIRHVRRLPNRMFLEIGCGTGSGIVSAGAFCRFLSRFGYF